MAREFNSPSLNNLSDMCSGLGHSVMLMEANALDMANRSIPVDAAQVVQLANMHGEYQKCLMEKARLMDMRQFSGLSI